MECIFCGNKFSSTREEDKVCPVCERAIARLHIGMTPDRLFELAKAEKDGRLAVIPSPESNENPIVMHGGRFDYADFCSGLTEMTPTTGFVAQMEAETSAKKEDNNDA